MRVVRLENLQQFQAVQLVSDGGSIGGPKVIPSCAEISILWNMTNGGIAQNNVIGRYAGAFSGTVTQADSILTALKTGGTWTALAALMPTTSAIFAVTIRDLNTPENPKLQSVAAGANGTSAGTALPDEVALAVTLRTGKAGIANRGRIFVPNWASNATGTGGVAAAGTVTALGNWAQVIRTALSAQGYTLVIGHVARKAYIGITGTDHPARPAGSVDVTSLVVRDNHWDTIRRRGLH